MEIDGEINIGRFCFVLCSILSIRFISRKLVRECNLDYFFSPSPNRITIKIRYKIKIVYLFQDFFREELIEKKLEINLSVPQNLSRINGATNSSLEKSENLNRFRNTRRVVREEHRKRVVTWPF